jgi:hypothetical protein
MTATEKTQLKASFKAGKMPKLNPVRVGMSTIYKAQVLEIWGIFYYVPIESIRKYIGNAQWVVTYGTKKDYKAFKTFNGLVNYINKNQ